MIEVRYRSVPSAVATRRPHVHIGHEVMRRLDQQNPEVPEEVDGELGYEGGLDNDEDARAAGEHQVIELLGNNALLAIAVQHENHRTGVRREKTERPTRANAPEDRG